MRIRNAKRLKGYSTSSLTLYDMCVLYGVSILFSSFFFLLCQVVVVVVLVQSEVIVGES